MAKAKYYFIENDELTANQQIVEDKFGIYRNMLRLFGKLSFYELAGRMAQYREHHNEFMPTDLEMSFALMRLLEEGLIGISNTGACENECCCGTEFDFLKDGGSCG